MIRDHETPCDRRKKGTLVMRVRGKSPSRMLSLVCAPSLVTMDHTWPYLSETFPAKKIPQEWSQERGKDKTSRDACRPIQSRRQNRALFASCQKGENTR